MSGLAVREDRLVVASGYFDIALHQPERIIEQAKQQLAGVEFDTFVATGLSGVNVAGLLAHALGKTTLLIRKDDDTSNHSGARAAGVLGRRWVFLDDFVSSGATRRRVKAAVESLVNEYRERGREPYSGSWISTSMQGPGGRNGYYAAPADDFTPEYLGDYSYARGEYGKWYPGGEDAW